MVRPLPTADQFYTYARYLYGITPRGKETVAAPPYAGIYLALYDLFEIKTGWTTAWKLAEIAMLCEFVGHMLSEE